MKADVIQSQHLWVCGSPLVLPLLVDLHCCTEHRACFLLPGFVSTPQPSWTQETFCACDPGVVAEPCQPQCPGEQLSYWTMISKPQVAQEIRRGRPRWRAGPAHTSVLNCSLSSHLSSVQAVTVPVCAHAGDGSMGRAGGHRPPVEGTSEPPFTCSLSKNTR